MAHKWLYVRLAKYKKSLSFLYIKIWLCPLSVCVPVLFFLAINDLSTYDPPGFRQSLSQVAFAHTCTCFDVPVSYFSFYMFLNMEVRMRPKHGTPEGFGAAKLNI